MSFATQVGGERETKGTVALRIQVNQEKKKKYVVRIVDLANF